MKLSHALLIVATLIAISLQTIVNAQTTYNNKWTVRPVYTSGSNTYTTNTFLGASAFGTYIYSVGWFENASSGYDDAVIFQYDSNSNEIAGAAIYYTTGSVLFRDVAVNSLKVYATGDYCNNVNCAGILKNFSSTDLSTSSEVILINTTYQSGRSWIYGDLHLYGACLDGDGNVYLIGEYVNKTASPEVHGVFAISFDSQLSFRWDAIYFVTDSSGNIAFNSTGWSCTIGPDGYLYFTSHVLYYDSIDNVLIPIEVFLTKADPTNGNVINDTSIPLWNSQYYIDALTYSYVDVSSNSNYIYIEFTYTDELPSATSPTVGGAIAAFNTKPSLVWRKNLTTSSNEVFESIAVGSNGDLVASGFTDNSYNTGLSNRVWNALVLILDSNQGLKKAILAGDTSSTYDTYANSIAVDALGSVYWVGYAGNDDQYIGYYDITSEVSLSLVQPSIEPSSRQAGKHEVVVKLSSPPINNTLTKFNFTRIHPTVKATIGVSLTRGYSIQSTPGGNSEAIIVATNEIISPPTQPPPPVPEKALVVSAVVIAVIIVISWKFKNIV